MITNLAHEEDFPGKPTRQASMLFTAAALFTHTPCTFQIESSHI